MPVKIDGVAGILRGIFLGDGDPFFRRDSGGDLRPARGIESLGIIDEIATFERAKTGVEMVKARIDKPQTDDGAFENAFVRSGRSFIGPEAKSAPDERLAAIEQGIAGTFEKNILRPRRQRKTIVLEPLAEEALLALPR
jgi:hypothetical protein